LLPAANDGTNVVINGALNDGVAFVVTEFDTAEGALLPTAFVATMVNVYAVLPASPETTSGLTNPEPVNPPGDDVAV
jgi:hypothetical protein